MHLQKLGCVVYVYRFIQTNWNHRQFSAKKKYIKNKVESFYKDFLLLYYHVNISIYFAFYSSNTFFYEKSPCVNILSEATCSTYHNRFFLM